MSHVIVQKEFGGRTLTLETGKIAKLAGASVMATYGGTTVLAAVVRGKPRFEIPDFLGLTIDYREKTSAAGKFPGGFKKREGPPSEKEILTMRMIDRPIRPLFPDGYYDEVLVQCFVMSHDQENDSDVIAGTAAAAALAISDIPFEGPSATVRVGRIHTDDGPRFVINPTVTQLEYSDLDLVLSGHADGMNMIEVGAAEISEKDTLAAMEFGYEHIKQLLGMINELSAKAGRKKVVGDLFLPTDEISETVRKAVEKPLTEARKIRSKAERNAAVDKIRDELLEKHFALKTGGTYGEYQESYKRRALGKDAYKRLEEKITRRLIAESGIRADGRGPTEIRQIISEVGVFARTHGSSMFQRGETQSLVTCTLGTGKDEQIVDGLLWARARTSRSSTACCRSTARSSCCTTTSRRSRPAR
ncbi:MAG: hypothetical protein LW650_09445 [Planctomycetaceae bacterium]|nr:hypothetical protein [Planctomycetaceae bacterium]